MRKFIVCLLVAVFVNLCPFCANAADNNIVPFTAEQISASKVAAYILTESLKKDNIIAVQEDLDGDGINEVIPQPKFLKGPFVIYYFDGTAYQKISIDQNKMLASEIHREWKVDMIFLNMGKAKTIVLYANLYRLPCEGKGQTYSSGNLILAYRYGEKKISLIRQYASDYVIDACTGTNTKAECSPPLGRFDCYFSQNRENNLLLVQTAISLNILDAYGNMVPAPGNLFIDPTVAKIRAFDIIGNDILVAAEKGSRIRIWDSADPNRTIDTDSQYDVGEFKEVVFDSPQELLVTAFRNGEQIVRQFYINTVTWSIDCVDVCKFTPFESGSKTVSK
jgi:hypothetical protein